MNENKYLKQIHKSVKDSMEAWQHLNRNPKYDDALDDWIQASISAQEMIEIFTALEQGLKKPHLSPGSVVQVKPNHDSIPCSLIVVTEVKNWGVQGFIMTSGYHNDDLVRYKGRAFIRMKNEDFEYVGEIPYFEDMKDDE